ncbi:taste receptor type 2 member 7-like [Petaurus breviceps papuanus]|uniref:taste receptor type 2 member 7-like n=1 Tax=Petaurus breviceps papuanus TaxID=3040969 RepID=UPI0036DBAA9E
MRSSAEKFFIYLATGECLLGILVNGFIVLVNFIEWIKSKRLSTSDVILVSLAISRIGLLCTSVWDSYLMVTSVDVPTQIRITDILSGVTHSSNVWFATILSIFYFLKIANFSNPFFLWMKWRINRVVSMLLMVPIITYLSISCAVMWRMNYHYGSLFSRGKERNVSQEIQMSKNMLLMIQVCGGLVNLIPFTLSTISFSLLILSLWRHTQRMQVNATGSRDPSTESHVRAMKAVSSFLVLCLLYFMAISVNLWSISEENSKFFYILSTPIMLLYPFGHSVTLILWNSKLRKAALRVSMLIRCGQRRSHLQAVWVSLRIIWNFLKGKKTA